MNRVFHFGEGFEVPDHTFLFEMLGPRQQHQEGQPVVDAMSLALGDLPPGTASSVHVHPLVAHLARVVAGHLTLKMKDPASDAPYLVDLEPRQAAYTAPGTFMQLINRSDAPCQVLYFVAPAFVFEQDAHGNVLYNDAHVLELTWEQLAEVGFKVPTLDDLEAIRRQRTAALARLSALSKARAVELKSR